VQRGLIEYRDHCSRCHGAPGVAPEEFALGMAPLPMNLVYAAGKSTPEEIYWTIRHGIKMTGMPAWGVTHTDEEIWNMVAFLQKLPSLSPAQYKVIVASGSDHHDHMDMH
jgi:mono/diheme cytochrome c family protein